MKKKNTRLTTLTPDKEVEKIFDSLANRYFSRLLDENEEEYPQYIYLDLKYDHKTQEVRNDGSVICLGKEGDQ